MTRAHPVPDVSAILAALPRRASVVAVRDDGRTVIGVYPEDLLVADAATGFASLDERRSGWWAGFVSYDAGRAVERVDARTAPEPVPDVALARFDCRLVLDASGAHIEGDGAGRETLARALRESIDAPDPPGPELRDWSSSLDRAAFTAAVRTVLERIRSGECYQTNLARRLVCERAADPIDLYGALERHNPAPHAALIRSGDLAIVSASPERFLRVDGRRVQTRPIKGTGRDPRALAASEKDRAENVMIVDLARNDLGRVCVPGSVRVPELCGVEHHPGLFHLVSTVTGVLRDDVGLGSLLRATFPPASITGAPKPRVMQIIEDLEPVRRGVYCGAIGWVDFDRDALDLSVAIRTFTVAGGRTFLGVGSGIVADSDPDAEWDETELKVARLLRAAGVSDAVPTHA